MRWQPIERRGDSPEDRAEQFIQAAIDRAPEPLRRLGEYLTRVLDEDEWPTAESLLLGIAVTPSSSNASDSILRSALKTIAEHDCDSWMVGVKCSGCRTCIAVDALAAAPEQPQ